MALEAISAIGPRVEGRLADYLGGQRTRWLDIDPRCAEPLDLLARFVAEGGKRLRPAFAYWSFVGGGGDPDDERIVDVGSALELLQAFALVHDDVMDDSATRRGAATVHRAEAVRHREGRGLGDSDLHGIGAAILVGNLAHAFADSLLSAADPNAVELWHELRVEINIGQYLDLAASASGSPDRATSRLIAQYKSGRYTIERPLQLGASLAGRPDLIEAWPSFGAPLGEAFQLRDDILGVFGDPTLTGKPVGADLIEAKPTLLLATAIELADRNQRATLDRVGHKLTEAEVDDVVATLEATGARRAVEDQISSLTATALDALRAVDITPPAHDALTAIAHYLAGRDA